MNGCPPRHVAGDVEKVGRVARQPINCRDDNHVAMRENGHQLFKLWPLGGRAGDLLTIYLLATGCLELGRRAGEVLRLRRDAGVAVNHAVILEQNSGTKKQNLISPLGLFHIS